MKRYYAVLLTSWALQGAQAQVTIGQAEMPYANDNLVRVRAVTNPLINYNATGPAFTWNFPNLAANSGDTTNYRTVASTNFVYAIAYADIFFNANRANHAKNGTDIAFSQLLPIQNPYTFRYRSSSVYKTVGFGAEVSGIPIPIIFDQHDVIYQLPLQYGNTSSSNSSYHIDVPNVGYYGFEQDRTNVVDGWGVITTPGGTFDVLRVKTTLIMRDSIFGFTIDRPVVREYKWLAQGLRVPVLQINTTTVLGTEVVSAIYYYDVPRSIQVVAPLATSLCPGATFTVNYASTGAFNAGGFFVAANQFRVQLSDAAGSFAAPVNIGSVTATASGTITANIPSNTPPGTGYRIRVVSTSPAYTGTSNSFDITVGGTPTASITADGSANICTGDALTLTAVGGPGYQWRFNGADIDGAVDATYAASVAGTYSVLVDNACGTALSNSIVVEVNTPPSVEVSQTVYLICEGSTVEIGAVDVSGQASVTYQWYLNDAPINGATSTTVTASLAGIYTMRAANTLTGCSSLSSEVVASVQVVTPPTVTANGATTFCEGGAVVLALMAEGDNTYQWYHDGAAIDGATGLQLDVDESGDYTAIATSVEGCTSSIGNAVTVTVEVLPEVPVVSSDGPATFCANGAVNLIAPPDAGVSFQWYQDGTIIDGAVQNTLMVTSSGAYSLSVAGANGCEASSAIMDVVEEEYPAAVNVISTEPTTFCMGGGTLLIADFMPGVIYQWMLDGVAIDGANSTQLSVTSGGSYFVVVSSPGGCGTASDPVVDVVVNPLPIMPVIASAQDTLFVTDEGAHQWFLDGIAISGATGDWWVPMSNGSYTLQVTDANGCSSTSEPYVWLTTAIDAWSGGPARVMPNPSNGTFVIELPYAQGQAYEILDATGKRVHQGRIAGMRTAVVLDHAVEGIYFLRVLGKGTLPVLRIQVAR